MIGGFICKVSFTRSETNWSMLRAEIAEGKILSLEGVLDDLDTTVESIVALTVSQ